MGVAVGGGHGGVCRGAGRKGLRTGNDRHYLGQVLSQTVNLNVLAPTFLHKALLFPSCVTQCCKQLN